jgi:ACT domain-containing protein
MKRLLDVGNKMNEVVCLGDKLSSVADNLCNLSVSSSDNFMKFCDMITSLHDSLLNANSSMNLDLSDSMGNLVPELLKVSRSCNQEHMSAQEKDSRS